MNYPIRVLFLETVMDRGGAEAMTMNYLRKIDRSKIQFDFLVHREYKAAFEDEIHELGGKIFRICPPYPQNWFKYKKDITNFFNSHPEYQIIHSNMMELGYPAYRAAAKCGIPIRICHAHTATNNRKLTLKRMIRIIYKVLMKKYITHKFACGEKAAEWVFGDKNIENVIYMKNAIDAEKYRYNNDVEDDVRKEFNLGKRFVIGHVGRFFEPKNHPFIIDIFAEIVKKEPDAILMLVGGGERDNIVMDQIKQKVEDLELSNNVIFTGVRTDVNRIMQAFNVFILPSLYEGFPVVMVEAQAAGLKCVISGTVPIECNITNNVEVLSLSESASVWAEHILQYKDSYNKKDMYNKIVSAGYDIKENAIWLEKFYIKEISKIVE